jgi:hypothetical protein
MMEEARNIFIGISGFYDNRFSPNLADLVSSFLYNIDGAGRVA